MDKKKWFNLFTNYPVRLSKPIEMRTSVTRPSWVDYLLGLAKCVSAKSHDTQTQHGCVVAGKCHEILATGCNGFPRGMEDDSALPTTRPAKYPWMIHSEVNAIMSSKADLDEATAYVTGPPCNNCLMQMWQKGIRKVVYIEGYGWSKDEQERAVKDEFLRQSGMVLEAVKPDLQWLVDVVLSDADMRAKAFESLLSNPEWMKEIASRYPTPAPVVSAELTSWNRLAEWEREERTVQSHQIPLSQVPMYVATIGSLDGVEVDG